MPNSDQTTNGAVAVLKPLALGLAGFAAACAIAGAWLMAGTGGRSAADAALLDWVEPMRARAIAVERDVSETDRLLRLFLLHGRPADAQSFERRRAGVTSGLAEFSQLAQSAERDQRETAEAFASAIRKWLESANQWYEAGAAAQQDGRALVLAQIGPRDPLDDLVRERVHLSSSIDETRTRLLAAGATEAETKFVRALAGLVLVLLASGVTFWLAFGASRPRPAPDASLDLGMLRVVLDQLPDGVAIFGETRRLLVSNLAVGRVIDTDDDGAGRLELFRVGGQPVAEDESPLTLALAGRHVHDRDCFSRHLDGSMTPVDVRAEAILDRGRASAAVVVVRDRSDEQRIDANLRAVVARAETAEGAVSEIGKRHRDLERELEQMRSEADTLRRDVETAQGETVSRTERFAQLVAGGGPIGVAVFDTGNLRLLDVNDAGLVLLGERRRARDVRGLTLTEIIPGAEASGIADLFRKVVTSSEPYSSEEYYAQGLRHGEAYWRFSLIPLASEPGGPADELVLLGLNTTETVEQRAAVHAGPVAARTWSVEDILLAIANDLRTPIVSIQGMVKLFRQKYAEAVPDVTALHYLELTERNADQIATLIDDLEELSRLSHTEITATEIPLAATIEEAWRAGTRSGIELRVAGPLPTVRADRALMLRAFRDLFDMATQMRRTDPGAFVHVRVRETDTSWEIEFSDNGRGVESAQEAERLFGPLAQYVAGSNRSGHTLMGAGLGLAAVRRIAELHGGSAHVSGTAGEGNVYTVSIAK